MKQRLAAIEGGATVIERGLVAYNSDTEAGAASLHRLLERQSYRLAYWRVAFAAVNYRRFFDINDLAGLCVERPSVFRGIHPLVARLIAEGRLHGLRLDHIDGLRDPAQYTTRLRKLISKARGAARRNGPFYVVVEKILGEGEEIPRFAGVAGTIGYEWLNAISRVLVDGKGLTPLERTWRAFTEEQASFADMLDAAKRRVIDTMLASEFTVLSLALARIAAGHFSTRDFTLERLREALLLYVLEFPVYRTYATAAGASDGDRSTINAAIDRARARWLGPDPEIFDFLRRAVMLDLDGDSGYSAPRVRDFALKLQQFTGPLMAKSLEDTTFYRYHSLLALNEVGGHPNARELTLVDFHDAQRKRVTTAPTGLTATATHDTKRGEDARPRILALSEIAADWETAVTDWHSRNAALVHHADGKCLPSAAHEYMIYQTLIGAWPGKVDEAFISRMQAYALKAAREGKQETSWANPNEAYEKALNDYIAALLDSTVSAGFLGSFARFAARTSLLGALNGLSQLALKALIPGVPDFYQGTEFWDLSLVDPDNRRPVDYSARIQALAAEGPDWAELAANWQDGRIKLALTHRLLRLRQEFADLFSRGDYQPLQVTGPHAGHVIAFARSFRQQTLVVAIARHYAPLTGRGAHWPAAINAQIEHETGATYRDALGVGADEFLDTIGLKILFKNIGTCVLSQN